MDWGEARKLLAERLVKPVSRQLLWQSVKPAMAEAGDLQQFPRYSTFRRAALERWAWYINERQKKIDAGAWSSKRPYSVADLLAAEAEMNAAVASA